MSSHNEIVIILIIYISFLTILNFINIEIGFKMYSRQLPNARANSLGYHSLNYQLGSLHPLHNHFQANLWDLKAPSNITLQIVNSRFKNRQFNYSYIHFTMSNSQENLISEDQRQQKIEKIEIIEQNQSQSSNYQYLIDSDLWTMDSTPKKIYTPVNIAQRLEELEYQLQETKRQLQKTKRQLQKTKRELQEANEIIRVLKARNPELTFGQRIKRKCGR